MIPHTRQVQTNTNTNVAAQATTVVTLGSLPTLGNTLFATASFGGGALAVSGGGVTTWTQVFFFGSHIGTTLYWGIVNGTPSTTITFTWTPNESACCRVMEYAGKLSQGQTTQASGVTTTVAPTNVTPAQSNELLIVVASSQLAYSAGPTAGFTSQGQLTITGMFHDTATLIHGAAAAINPSWTTTASGWDCGICSFVLPTLPGDNVHVGLQYALAQ